MNISEVIMKFEYKKYYLDELTNYKTISSKKGFLTRSRKGCEEYLQDINAALKMERPMLYGDPMHMGHAMSVEREIDFINKLYTKLKK